MFPISPAIRCSNQPRQGIDTLDTIIVHIGIIIQCKNELGIIVMDALQRAKLTAQDFLIPNGSCHLYIKSSFPVYSNKIHR